MSDDARSIYNILALLPSGTQSAALHPDEFGKYLGEHYNTDGEKDRNRRHALRDELYRDGGVLYMQSFIDQVFKDAKVRELRKQFASIARFNNVLKRIVHELATVYAEPARRFVGDSEQANYDQVLDAVQMDEQMLAVSRLLNLHRALLVGFRVRQRPDGTREPVLDIASPANVRAVMHPNDDREVVAWMIRTSYRSRGGTFDVPKWTLWSAVESMQLREDLTPIGDSYQLHGLGMIPWVPVTLGPPASGFWPGQEGEDLVAGHLASWFNNILLLKETKSATKQTAIQGDGTNMMRGQSADTEVPSELAEGQTLQTVDMSMDLSMFRDTADHVLQQVAQNYGLSPAIITHQGVQSAEARELMRMPLREIRKQQQIPLRRFETQLAKVMAAVLAVDMPSLRFKPDGWRIEFGESETPLDPLSEQTLFEKRRAAGLDNSVAMLMRLRPGLSEEDAMLALETNVEVETERNRMMRPLQAISGSLGAEAPSDQVRVTETAATPAAATPPVASS